MRLTRTCFNTSDVLDFPFAELLNAATVVPIFAVVMLEV